MSAAHTPWTAHLHSEALGDDVAHINGSHHCAIAMVHSGAETETHRVTREEAQANAAFIIRAVNRDHLFDQVVKAAQAVMAEHKDAPFTDFETPCFVLLRAALDAVAKAGDTPQPPVRNQCRDADMERACQRPRDMAGTSEIERVLGKEPCPLCGSFTH